MTVRMSLKGNFKIGIYSREQYFWNQWLLSLHHSLWELIYIHFLYQSVPYMKLKYCNAVLMSSWFRATNYTFSQQDSHSWHLYCFSMFSLLSLHRPFCPPSISLHHLLPFTPAWRLIFEVSVVALLVLLRSSVRPSSKQLSLPSPLVISLHLTRPLFLFLLSLSEFFFFFFSTLEEDRTPRSSSWPSVFWLSGAH